MGAAGRCRDHGDIMRTWVLSVNRITIVIVLPLFAMISYSGHTRDVRPDRLIPRGMRRMDLCGYAGDLTEASAVLENGYPLSSDRQKRCALSRFSHVMSFGGDTTKLGPSASHWKSTGSIVALTSSA